MTSEPPHSSTADADRCLPADGLSLRGEYQGSGYAGRRFLVGRSDGQTIQLPLLLYERRSMCVSSACDSARPSHYRLRPTRPQPPQHSTHTGLHISRITIPSHTT